MEIFPTGKKKLGEFFRFPKKNWKFFFSRKVLIFWNNLFFNIFGIVWTNRSTLKTLQPMDLFGPTLFLIGDQKDKLKSFFFFQKRFNESFVTNFLGRNFQEKSFLFRNFSSFERFVDKILFLFELFELLNFSEKILRFQKKFCPGYWANKFWKPQKVL